MARLLRLLPLIEQALARRGCDEWSKLLADCGVPAAPINTVDKALTHPQVFARGMTVEAEHPSAGTVQMVGSPIKLSATPTEVRCASPEHGQHTGEVLEAMGVDPQRLQDLRARGVAR